jgi:glycosyltransferase involved in cell wall biosynthesis
MKISIAIPAYAKDEVGVQYLRDSFESIERQTLRDFEVVVSDHSKINDLADLCDEYSTKFPIKYIKNFYDRGLAHPGTSNSNNAMDYCSGEYIKILHHDDFFVDDKGLEKIVDAMDSSKKEWLVCGFNHTRDCVNFFDPRTPQYPDHLLVGNNLIGAPTNATVRNDCKLYFDPDAMMSMDHEWYHRLRMKYGMPYILDEVIVTSRLRDDRLSAGEASKADIVIEGDGSAWHFFQDELEYLQKKHADFFENWEYPNG